jgi:hypothetical protein
MKNVLITTMFMACFLFAFDSAYSHSWYDAACCNERDCQPVEPHVVTPVSGGWLIQVKPGDHKFAKDVRSWLVPYNSAKVKRSRDDQYHVCLSPYVNPETNIQSLYCVYIPYQGF